MAKPATAIRFRAKLSRPAEVGSWLFLRLPQDASEMLPTRSMVSVEGSLNGYPFRATLQPDGAGGHWLKLDKNLSGGAGVKAGEVVELEMEPVAVEPEPDLPDDLRSALDASPKALAVWLNTTPVARRDWIQWMTTGKRAETRAIRLGKMIDMLSKGKRRICCFDRSGRYSKSLSCPIAAPE